MVLIRRDNDSVGIGIKRKLLLACRGVSILSCHFYCLECTISVIVVEQVSLVAFAQIFFYEFQAQLTTVLTDGLKLVLRKETINLGYFRIVHFSGLR